MYDVTSAERASHDGTWKASQESLYKYNDETLSGTQLSTLKLLCTSLSGKYSLDHRPGHRPTGFGTNAKCYLRREIQRSGESTLQLKGSHRRVQSDDGHHIYYQ